MKSIRSTNNARKTLDNAHENEDHGSPKRYHFNGLGVTHVILISCHLALPLRVELDTVRMANKECPRHVVLELKRNTERLGEQVQQEEKSPKFHERIDFGSRKGQDHWHCRKEPL